MALPSKCLIWATSLIPCRLCPVGIRIRQTRRFWQAQECPSPEFGSFGHSSLLRSVYGWQGARPVQGRYRALLVRVNFCAYYSTSLRPVITESGDRPRF
jgi:hypothetical protein